MHSYDSQKAVSQYRQLGLQGEVSNASPHRLIQMLFEGLLQQLDLASAAFDRKDIAARGEHLGRAIAIVEGLRDSLNLEVAELARQLDSLYEYCTLSLLNANKNQNPDQVREVRQLLWVLKTGWDAIAPVDNA
ncbi:flagellar export chaperone FliS [Gilvimarinus chinensis]|uniref:flagellar export chaperone FliS n=1 Tax=Gilvimarinus chinensis TaxID=396005 RepID=UPI000375CECF|nr:flagellar export chaperone FliS [Gilvimarinus chinensis]